ncbi:hypothetical protein [Methanospirillum sp.]
MWIELVLLGISVMNCVGTIGIWMRYVREFWGVVQMVRVSEEGDVEVR